MKSPQRHMVHPPTRRGLTLSESTSPLGALQYNPAPSPLGVRFDASRKRRAYASLARALGTWRPPEVSAGRVSFDSRGARSSSGAHIPFAATASPPIAPLSQLGSCLRYAPPTGTATSMAPPARLSVAGMATSRLRTRLGDFLCIVPPSGRSTTTCMTGLTGALCHRPPHVTLAHPSGSPAPFIAWHG